MKKKGLIVATIVMVLVLAVSLSTATYAWFAQTTVTTIQSFSVSVVSDNAVNIGVKVNNTYNADATSDDFVHGTVTYSGQTAGAIGGGTWEGEKGLDSTLTLEDTILWGAQKAAVGVTSASSAGDATYDNTKLWEDGGTLVISAVKGAEDEAGNPTIADQKAAYANNNGTANGDYVYIFLGATPSKKLTSNELIIAIEADKEQGTIIGMNAAIHVAYRINGASTWTDVELFGDSVHYNDSIDDIENPLTEAQQAAYNTSYGTTMATTGVGAVVIDNLKTTQGAIDQIEIVIYIAGADSDCRNEAKGAGGDISIFFNAVVEGAA